MNELNLNLNELNKLIQARHDEKIFNREKAWNYLIECEHLFNSLLSSENRKEKEIELKSNLFETQDNLEFEALKSIYERYSFKLNETKVDLVGLDELNLYLNDLIEILIENYFSYQKLFLDKKKSKSFKVKNVLIVGLEGSGMLTQITKSLVKYQSLFESKSLPLLKIFKLDMSEILKQDKKNQIELIFKSIQIANKMKQPHVILLLNLEELCSKDSTPIKLHLIGDLLNEFSANSNRIFICVSHAPWLLHPALVYQFEHCIHCAPFSSPTKATLISSLLDKFKQKLNLKEDLVKLSESYTLNGKLIHSMIEKLKPLVCEKSPHRTWKKLKTELDVLKRFNRIKMLKRNSFVKPENSVEDLNQLREECLEQAKLFLDENLISEHASAQFEVFKKNYRCQFDFP